MKKREKTPIVLLLTAFSSLSMCKTTHIKHAFSLLLFPSEHDKGMGSIVIDIIMLVSCSGQAFSRGSEETMVHRLHILMSVSPGEMYVF